MSPVDARRREMLSVWKTHLHWQRHARFEISAAIDKLKAQHPAASLSVRYLAGVLDMTGIDNEKKCHMVEHWVH